MNISNINFKNVSFSGCWQVRSEKVVGKIPSETGGSEIILRDIRYVPYKHEDSYSAREIVNKYNGKIVAVDTTTDSGKGDVKYYINKAKLGKATNSPKYQYPIYPSYIYGASFCRILPEKEEFEVLNHVGK